MALVKRSKITSEAAQIAEPVLAEGNSKSKSAARPARGRSREETVAERLAAATEQLASGLNQAAAATRELESAMSQIAAGAEEAAGASQQQSASVKRIVASLTVSKSEAEGSARRSDSVSQTLAEMGAQITSSVRAIERNAQRQLNSANATDELQKAARSIGDITRAVSQISDRTNLHALNAAIEAARAGELGRGFAVVAKEVRALADRSDRSAREVQELTSSIQIDLAEVVAALKTAATNAAAEAVSAKSVIDSLDARRKDMSRVAEDSRRILISTIEAETSALEAEKGAEQIAAAAEQQASGATEAQSAVQQQAKSLDQSQVAARALALLAEQIRQGLGGSTAVEQISSAAEELSATVQELSGAASEVMAAVEQINRACQMQASATQETSAALAQIEKSGKIAQSTGSSADQRVRALDAGLQGIRTTVENLIAGVDAGMQFTQDSLATVARLAKSAKKIEKIVNAIELTTVQTAMLAVSGLVEAARGADAGRGFAVVSNDIRTLANEASENIENAKDTVREILDQIGQLERDLEQIVISAQIEVQNNQLVSASLQKIGVEVDALASGTRLISEQSNSILEAIVETASGARQVSAAAEEASAASRQAATAAAEQSQGAEDLAAAIEEIAALAEELTVQNA